MVCLRQESRFYFLATLFILPVLSCERGGGLFSYPVFLIFIYLFIVILYVCLVNKFVL